jgi:two-component system chemotaxis sensor kinase CheA
MQVLLIRVGREIFALPTEAIGKNIRLARDQIISVEGKQVVIDNEEVVPLVFLGEVLGSPREYMEDDSDTISVFIMEHAQKQIGFCVDGFVGEQEVVIKSLGTFLKRTPYVTGAAVLGNGDVVAILHVSELMNAARSGLTGIVSSQQLVTDQEIQERAKAPSILVVDDSLTTRELEKSILEASGYDVYVAVDGLDGLGKVSEGEFDLIVSDVEMPRMDGFQMVEMLKQSERSKDIPVIMVTALQKDEEKRRGMEVGASAYIVKSSFDQSNLLDTIQALIG